MSGKPPGTRWVAGYERRYALTAEGTVWCCLGPFARKIHPWQSRRRLYVRLSRAPRSGRRDRRRHALAWLVLATFGPYRKYGQVPIHRNGDLLDCRLTNLRWGTAAERLAHLVRLGVWAQRWTVADVRRIFHSRRSSKALARAYQTRPQRIREIWRRKKRALTTRRWQRPA